MRVFKGIPGGAREAYIAEGVRHGARATPMVSSAYSSVHSLGKDNRTGWLAEEGD